MKKLLNKLTIKRKIILTLVAIYACAALLDGHWFVTIVLFYFSYWYANKPISKPNVYQPLPSDYQSVDEDYNQYDPNAETRVHIPSNGSLIENHDNTYNP